MGSEERPRNQEELPFINNVNTVVSPASPRARHSVGSNRSFTNAMHNALHFTTITKSPNYGFGRSFLSTQNNFESGHPSYSASPSIIRNQTLALGNLNSLPESDKKEGSPPKDPNVAGQSNLSLLLQRESKTPSPPELATKSSNSPPSIAAAIAQIGQTQNNKNNHNVDKIHSESDGNFETIENIQDESRPLLHHQFGIPSNYGIEGGIGDDVISIEDDPWAEKSWIGTWLPCVGDDYLPNYEGEERPQQKFQFNAETIFREVILNPISYIPAVILGLLLNLLDAISYGMITFPISNPIFREFGPDGISMFFVSCIVSQVIYSGGFSIFGGGNGSMMIEVVPFLHIMAEIIIREANDPSEIIPTTILSFALSSVLTGVVFLLMGAFKLGSLIEFFPRHILVGCIGGVGWFLIATAIEVSAHLDENLLRLFDDFHTFALWGSALGLALLLRIIHTKCQHALVVPFYFMIVPLFFYLTVYLFELKWDDLRSDGWVFPMPEGDAPWYRFYSYYGKSKKGYIYFESWCGSFKAYLVV
ncbi:2200_t:CDS:2 [Funneliformis mosseae]|uniref:2200_t:CDS:1 n=1 Tax=Funneliformis mosseae TaxID=27381 RepID=A0A9N9DGN4_FUNMO|nr:2200_t:CDS:2 [Funneliformis mosseae]